MCVSACGEIEINSCSCDDERHASPPSDVVWVVVCERLLKNAVPHHCWRRTMLCRFEPHASVLVSREEEFMC